MNVIGFFARRPVPVGLMTATLVIGGLWSALTIRREFFPELEPDMARVAMPYPGATPEEVEESIARKVEDALADIEEVDRIETTVFENGGSVVIKFIDGADLRKRVDDIRSAIAALQDLPEEADRITVSEFEPNLPVIQLALSGEVGEEALKRGMRRIADDLRALPGMGQVRVSGVRDYEIRIDCDQGKLIQHGIPITRVADAVNAWMRKIPGGRIRTPDGDLNVRTIGAEERAATIQQIVLKADPDGSMVRVGDVARVREDFVDIDYDYRFNGRPAAGLIVFKVGNEDAIRIAELVRGYVAGRRGEPLTAGFGDWARGSPRRIGYEAGRAVQEPLPGELTTHNELARIIEGRLELLTRNALQGAALVFICLMLGIQWRAAFWVMVGIGVAVGGTLLGMQLANVTLNLLTMFGLLVVLGMLADDAIVVSENIERTYREGASPEDAAEHGTRRVFWPIVGSVSTTIVAFLPLAMVKGRIGEMLGALPWVVAIALAMSVLEATTMLPRHMASGLQHMAEGRGARIDRLLGRWTRWRESIGWPRLIGFYGTLVEQCVRHRYVTTAAAIALSMISLAMVAGGRVTFTFLPADDSENMVVDFRLPMGSSIEQTRAFARRVEIAAQGQPEVKAVIAQVGVRTNFETSLAEDAASHVGQIFLELTPVESRERRSSEVIDAIRTALGSVDETESFRFTEISGGPGGADITLEVRSEDSGEVRAVADAIKLRLTAFTGVQDIADDSFASQPELRVSIRPAAAALGFTPAEVARQLRGSLFGLDAHVYSAEREDIDVRVRLDENSRRRAAMVQDLWLISPTGQRVPLKEIAEVRRATGFAAIRRIDRERTVTVTADCITGVSPEEIMRELRPQIAEILAAHPEVRVRDGGRQKDLNEAFSTLPSAAMAAFAMIYVILAWLFSSYVQPFAVMMAIPFGIIGVVWGHLFLGFDLTFLSIIGFVALAGVVVNNSLILVDFANAGRRDGLSLQDALIQAGRKRLRPILLTTTTTVLGLSPLILETSFQARFLIPMAISLCGGLISSAFLTLLLLPAILMIFDDIRKLPARLLGVSSPP
ncbi:MAG: efflux RND transporter permease subunit [Phycisphaeraceae bacterium]|nr:efflux RND transporter permease subunit [Phycisphaeraceae bacterium]